MDLEILLVRCVIEGKTVVAQKIEAPMREHYKAKPSLSIYSPYHQTPILSGDWC